MSDESHPDDRGLSDANPEPARGAPPGRAVAVVTGASAGIGRSFALALARRGFDLWLVARRTDRLEALATELAAHGAATRCLGIDLCDPEGPHALLRALDEARVVPELFVNNAGFGYFGPALDEPLAEAVRMVRLNVETVTVLSLGVLERMKKAGRGGLLNVSSTAAFQATPFHALYGATKGFELLLTEGLAVELEGTGVRAMAVCPGYTRTEFQGIAGVPMTPPAAMVGDPDDCAERSLDAYMRGETVFVHRAINRLGPLAARLLPRVLVARAGGRMFRPRA